MTCPEHGEPYPCSHPVASHWCLEDRDDGWYVISPWGGVCGPFTEDAGAAKIRELRAYPVWCPSCLVPMVQSIKTCPEPWLPGSVPCPRCKSGCPFVAEIWTCPKCQLEIDQSEIAGIIRVNE